MSLSIEEETSITRLISLHPTCLRSRLQQKLIASPLPFYTVELYTLLASLARCLTLTLTLTLKRAQRASTIGVKLVSSTSQSTPMSECMAHYGKMFNSSIPLSHNGSSQSSDCFSTTSHQHTTASSSTFEPSPFSFPPDEATLLSSGLLDQISLENIKSQLKRMSSTASCGNDGITVIMLRTLLDTTFPEHLF